MKFKFIFLAFISVAILTGMIMQIIFLLQEKNHSSAVFILIGLLSFLTLMTLIMKNPFLEFKQDLPANDELSKKIKLFSSGRAYYYSLYIWIILFAFQANLDKDDILLLGLLGMVLSLFISWLLTKYKKGLEE